MTNEHSTETPSLADPLEAKMPEPKQDRYFTHGAGKQTLERDAQIMHSMCTIDANDGCLPVANPAHGPHDFEPSYSGMVCGRMVERPDGSGDECGEPIKSPIHDPAGYLEYREALRAALAEWVAGEQGAAGTSGPPEAPGASQAVSAPLMYKPGPY